MFSIKVSLEQLLCGMFCFKFFQSHFTLTRSSTSLQNVIQQWSPLTYIHRRFCSPILRSSLSIWFNISSTFLYPHHLSLALRWHCACAWELARARSLHRCRGRPLVIHILIFVINTHAHHRRHQFLRTRAILVDDRVFSFMTSHRAHATHVNHYFHVVLSCHSIPIPNSSPSPLQAITFRIEGFKLAYDKHPQFSFFFSLFCFSFLLISAHQFRFVSASFYFLLATMCACVFLI